MLNVMSSKTHKCQGENCQRRIVEWQIFCSKKCAEGKPMTVVDKPVTAWSTDNAEGVPCLLPDYQANMVDDPVEIWGTRRRTDRMRGTWCFFTTEARFTALIKKPYDVINSGCINSVEMNLGVYEQTPYYEVIHKVGVKRWIARYWQECGGVRIFVDLNVAPRWREVNLLGVPVGWRAYATRGSVNRLDDVQAELDLACSRAGHKEIVFLGYGGGKGVQDMCMKNKWSYRYEYATARRMEEGENGEGRQDNS